MNVLEKLFKRFTLTNTEMKESIPLKDNYHLYNYQKVVVDWMREKEGTIEQNGVRGGIINLSMGLGKTIISLYHILLSRKMKGETNPSLIVMSKTLLYEWRNEGVLKFFDDVNVLYYHNEIIGKKEYDNISINKFKTYDMVFTTYDVCLSIYRKYKYEDIIIREEGTSKIVELRTEPFHNVDLRGPQSLFEVKWERLVCDESQRFANPKTQIFRSIMSIYSRFRWCLSGTPIKNYETDVWAQLRMCGFDLIRRPRDWKRRLFDLYKLKNHIYILNYKTADIKMPEKEEKVYKLELDGNQQIVYDTMWKKLCNTFSDYLKDKAISYASVLSMFTRLRQTCIAPYLISKEEKFTDVLDKANSKEDLKKLLARENETYDIDSWMRDETGDSGISSPKIKKIVKIAEECSKKGEKVLVFSMFVKSLDLVKKSLRKQRISSVVMTGSTSMSDRLNAMEVFKKTKDINVMLLHYKVGGEGINLTEATHVVFADIWWTPTVHSQGISRVWRIGQTKKVSVHWIIMNNTIEIQILKMCEKKQKMSDYYLHGDGEEVSENSGMNVDELKKLLGF